MPVINKLYYVYDPMCSWCWAYQKVWTEIQEALRGKVDIIYVLGGLAPDSDTPMPDAMQGQIAAYWKKIERQVGTTFNHDFWIKNTPRRSTYPSCRAVLAARAQGAEQLMVTAIQQAYYLNARNPSDNDVLVDLAKQIGLDEAKFTKHFYAQNTHDQLLNEIAFARSIGGNSFPSLFVEMAEQKKGEAETKKSRNLYPLPVDYLDAQKTIQQILTLLNAH